MTKCFWAATSSNTSFSSDNLLNLLVETSSIDSVLFDQPYDLQLLGSGGSGNYLWSISSGALPEGFSLNAQTGVLSGSFNYLTLTSLDPSTFTISLSDECSPFTLTDNSIVNLQPATQSYTIGPDIDKLDQCWELFESGGFKTARSLSNNDYVYLFYQGEGVQIYFGTENINLALPSEVTVDGVVVTPTPINPNTTDPSLWLSNGVTIFTRYTLASNLNFGNHVIRIQAPSSGNRQVAFQELILVHESLGSTSNQSVDVSTGKSLYRCSDQRADLPAIQIEPVFALDSSTLMVTDLPAGIVSSGTTSTDNLMSTDNLTTSTNTTTSGNLTTSDNTTTSGNLAKPRLSSEEDDFVVFFEVYDENFNRIDTIFENSVNGFNIAPDNSRVKLVYLNKDDPRERYESIEESIESVVEKAEASSSPSVETSSSSTSSSSSGGGGGGCLLK